MNYKVATLPQFDKDLKLLAKKYRSIGADPAVLELIPKPITSVLIY